MNGKTLTAEQCSKLSLYILMTTKTREGEAEAWSNVAKRNAKRYAARIWSVASFTSRAILARDTERR